MSEKCLLDQWRDMAYDRNLPKDQLEKFWGTYFTIEREIYEQLLENPDEEVKGTVKELAEKYGQDVMTMVGSLNKTGTPTALLKVDNLLYQVRLGNYLGQNYGKITKISETAVELREIVQDATGDWIERTASLDLQEGKK